MRYAAVAGIALAASHACLAESADEQIQALAISTAAAEAAAEVQLVPVDAAPDSIKNPDERTWLDRTHAGLHGVLWRSAMRVDGWFGQEMTQNYYSTQTRGSITPILLWDEYNGFNPKFRFRVKMPLPALGERYNAFVGTFTREEFVTEREQASGAIPRQRTGGETADDQMLVGIQYRQRMDDRFEADAGIRLRTPIDPFVKAGYRFRYAFDGNALLTLSETAFWQNSEGFGLTSRIDFDKPFHGDSLLRWTTSATISEESQGVRGYSAVTAYHGLRDDRGIAGQVFTSVEFDAPVPLGEYGLRAAYRQQVMRKWLVLEIRPSVTWPKHEPEETRKASWGIGIGLEMFFGNDEFQARPATF